MSQRICVELYRALAALRPEWHQEGDDLGAMKVVMSFWRMCGGCRTRI